MAESAVIFLLEKLAAFVDNEARPLRGIQEEVVSLRGEFERMKAFLRDADTLEESDAELKVWVKQVRDTAQDAEDILDELLLLQEHSDHGEGFCGYLLRRVPGYVKQAKSFHRISSQLRVINNRIKNISKGYKRLQHKFNGAEQGLACMGTGNSWQDCRGDALLLEKTDLVGIEKPKEQLVEWLVKGSSGREVVSLAGMGGLGKTTLAKQVYDHAGVKKHFKIRAWITVSQNFKQEELLRDLVQQLFRIIRTPVPEGLDGMDSNRLKEIIKDLLHRRRYLIVLDDIWHLYEWNAIRYALPNNNYGSRVMLTTRHSDIASSSKVDSAGKIYDLEPLPPQESWDLFCTKTFKGKQCPAHLEDICRDILRQCEGLPLAIVAVSGVLATKSKRRIDEWEMVGRSLGAEIEGNDKLKVLKTVLSLSYNDLPYYLKSCFQYLGIFPEDHLIEHSRLIRLWMAEGFIAPREGRTLEEVAEDYFKELLSRSLIQVVRTTTDGRVNTFRIHDLLREIIISKSRDQNFATIAKEKDLPWPEKMRRLSIHKTLQNVQPNRCVSQLRSLFMFGVVEKPNFNTLFPDGFKLLNVLELQNSPLKRFPVAIMNLFHLRYLSFRGTRVKTIPSFIGKFRNLETLDLKYSCVSELPIEILNLPLLRHLLVYRLEYESFAYFHPKYGFKALPNLGALKSLQKLCFIEADEDCGDLMRELGKLSQLRRLGILKLREEDGRALCSSIEKLTNLRALSITAIEENEVIDLHHISSPPLLIQRLYLRGRLDALPHWIPSLQSLVRLHLKWSRLREDPLVFLQHLPNLVHLELLQVCDGSELCFKSGGFAKLKFLALDGFDELKSVQVEEGAMPGAEKLIIQRCKLLRAVPSGIEHLRELKVLEFFEMPEELIRTLHPDGHGSDFWKIEHVPEINFTVRRDGDWEVHSLWSLRDGESSAQPSITQLYQTRIK